jgi:hypothetical protein
MQLYHHPNSVRGDEDAFSLLVEPGWELEWGPGKDQYKHAQNRTCYRIPIPHEKNKDNRILKGFKRT